MSDLRNKIIRLAHENPELRKDLLPLLQKSALGGGRAKKDSLGEAMEMWYVKLAKHILQSKTILKVKAVANYLSFEYQGQSIKIYSDTKADLIVEVDGKSHRIGGKSNTSIGDIYQRMSEILATGSY